MIALQRERTALAIPKVFRGADRERRELGLLRFARDGGPKLETSLWKPAKKQLKRETAGKCAYCEAPTDAVAHGDVEHFRPKGVYWWLALCYDNYLYGCQVCNQSYKNDLFPIHGPALKGPGVTGLSEAALQALVGTFAPDPLDANPRVTLAQHLKALRREKAGLIDPYQDDPAAVFAYHADAVNRMVEVIPGTDPAWQQAAKDSIRVYGLNREELRLLRWHIYEPASLAGEGLRQQPGNAALEGILRSMARPERPFAGMVRYFLGAWGLGL